MENTIEYVHSKGLGFGLYGDKGNLDYNGSPGQLGHERQDAEFLAKYRVDWFKEDSCHSDSGSHQKAIGAYAKMRDALNSTGYPVWFALCGWKTWYATDPGGGQQIGNSWRVGPDTGSGWNAVMQNVEAGIIVGESKVPGPSAEGGAWSDGSLLLNPGYSNGKLPPSSPSYMSSNRHRSMFSLWCTMGFNLLLTGNLSALNPYVIETYTNHEVIGA
jgi:alpha-galactosidase